MPGFLTNDFYLYDPTDQTKQIRFDVSALLTGTLNTLTVPYDASGAMVIAEYANIFSARQQFGLGATMANDGQNQTLFLQADPNGGKELISIQKSDLSFVDWLDEFGYCIDTSFRIRDDSDATKIAAFQCSGITTATTRTLTIPDASGTIALTAAQTWTTLQTFRDTTFKLVDDGDSSKTCVFSLGGATANADLTLSWAGAADRTVALPALTGLVPVVGDDPPAVAAGALGKLDLTAQTAAIGSTNLSSGAPAGYYIVDYTLEVTTGDVTAGTIQFGIAYTDDIGATTQVGALLALTGTGRDRGSFQVYLASGELSYSTALVGIFGTSVYALRARVTYLG